MWSSRSEQLLDGRSLRYSIHRDGSPATFVDVMQAWQSDSEFREWFNLLLAACPFQAFRWETPGVTAETGRMPFEFVLLESPTLDRRPDPAAFAEHFHGMSGEVISFGNLGGDAVMIVPQPLTDAAAYVHLATFVRSAPESQRHALWQTVGNEMVNRLSEKPVWLSTAGAGVAWLHVRLDDRPKYYGFAPYRNRLSK